jgi:hypothetical protein
MPLPETIRVKLSSEAAESISITPVVVREMPTRELVEHMLGVSGKDLARIHELLLRGTLVSGASRFRWSGWDAVPADIEAVLATFPDRDPARAFAAERCVSAALRASGRRIEIPREAGTRKPLFRRGSFWEALMSVAATGGPQYVDYSYRERADVYSVPLSIAAVARLRDAAGLVKYATLQQQIRAANLESVELYVTRTA